MLQNTINNAIMEEKKSSGKKNIIKKGLLGLSIVSVAYGAKRIIELRQMVKRLYDQMDQN